MAWLKSNWRWLALNLGAVFVLIFEWSRGSTDWSTPEAPDPGLQSGKWAIRLLLFCLAITPLQTCFGWRSLSNLRKPAGLWAFGFAGLHVLIYLTQAGWAWLWPLQLYLALGLLALLILTALALTSTRWAMRQLKQGWKRLHRLVYLAGGAATTHAILATTMSKKIFVYDPQAIYELAVYLMVLVVLLALRVPAVKQWLIGRRLQRALDVPVIPLPEPWPQINGRERVVPLDAPVFEADPGVGSQKLLHRETQSSHKVPQKDF